MSRNPSNRTGRGAFPNMNTMVTGSGRAEDSSNQNIPSAYRSNRSVWEYPSLSNRQTPDHKSNGLPTGSGALIHDSQADTAASAWGANSQSTLWNTDAPQNRSTSGSTSPTRTRDSLHGPFFDTNHVAPLGQTRYNGSVRPKSFLDGDEDKENNGAFPPSFGSYDAERAFTRHEKRPSQDPGFMSMNVGAVGAPPSRDGSIPPSRHSDGSHHSPPAYRESLGYAHGHVPSYSMSSAGPQTLGSGLPASSAVQTNGNRRGFNGTNGATGINGHRPDDSDLAAHLQRTLALEPGAAPSQNGGSQLNPGSQPWLGGLGLGFNPSPAESYTDHFNQFVTRTRSSGDRFPPSPAHMSSASPAPMLYQMNEPRLYNQANPLLMNQNSLNPWPQASGSRGPRMAPGVDRRDVPSPAQYLAPQAAHLYQPNFYNQNFPSQFPQNAYDALPRGPVGQVVSPYAMQGKYYHLLGHGNAPSRKNQDSSNQLRSQVLEDFRNNVKHAKRAELKDIYGHIVEFSGDQHGSRFIQQKLETANSDEKDQIFSEIQDNVIQLMKDVFGNYVIQKFFEHGNQIQKKFLASQMKGQVVELSMQMYSCRVVQKALEHVLVDQQAELAKELEPEILKVVKEQNGNHVVQKVIEKVPREHIGFIMDAFRGQVSQLASHMYGCRVVQRLLEFGEAKDKAEILAEIHASAQVLVTDQYGNYVIQHVIENGKPEDRVKMVKLVTLQAVTLSRHKFASNVVERCVQCCTPEERWAIWQQLSPPGPEGANTLQATMKDQYGNYVIQKLLNVFQGDEREAFIAEIKPHLEALKKVCTGRQIQAIERLFNATNSTSQNTGATTTATAPAAPALQLDSSAAPTPVLTMEPNSPQSSSTPSTNASAVGDSVEEEKQAQLLPGGVSLRLQVQES